MFGSLGFILDSTNPRETTVGELTMNILARACFAVGWAFFGTHRMFKSMIPLAGVQVSVIWLLHRSYSHAPKLAANSAELADKLALDSAGAMFLVISGYVLFLLFFQWEGKSFFAAHTEMTLATEIHRSLVPELSFRTDAFQFLGTSFPSGPVGGDLVDIVVRNETWLGYVADVSGPSCSRLLKGYRLARRSPRTMTLNDLSANLEVACSLVRSVAGDNASACAVSIPTHCLTARRGDCGVPCELRTTVSWARQSAQVSKCAHPRTLWPTKSQCSNHRNRKPSSHADHFCRSMFRSEFSLTYCACTLSDDTG